MYRRSLISKIRRIDCSRLEGKYNDLWLRLKKKEYFDELEVLWHSNRQYAGEQMEILDIYKATRRWKQRAERQNGVFGYEIWPEFFKTIINEREKHEIDSAKKWSRVDGHIWQR